VQKCGLKANCQIISPLICIVWVEKWALSSYAFKNQCTKRPVVSLVVVWHWRILSTQNLRSLQHDGSYAQNQQQKDSLWHHISFHQWSVFESWEIYKTESSRYFRTYIGTDISECCFMDGLTLWSMTLHSDWHWHDNSRFPSEPGL